MFEEKSEEELKFFQSELFIKRKDTQKLKCKHFPRTQGSL